jgi:hypothetical protein
LPPPRTARIACANLEPTPASWRQFPELANEEAAVEEAVDDVEDALDVGPGVVADDVDGLLELPHPARSPTTTSVAETVPIFMELAFPLEGANRPSTS